MAMMGSKSMPFLGGKMKRIGFHGMLDEFWKGTKCCGISKMTKLVYADGTQSLIKNKPNKHRKINQETIS